MIRHQCARVHYIVHHLTKALLSSIHRSSLKFVMQTAHLTLATGKLPFSFYIYIYIYCIEYLTETHIHKYLLTRSIQTNNCEFNFRILGQANIFDLFTIDKHTGQLFIKDTAALDVNHLKSENIYFSVEVRWKIVPIQFWMAQKHWLQNIFTPKILIENSETANINSRRQKLIFVWGNWLSIGGCVVNGTNSNSILYFGKSIGKCTLQFSQNEIPMLMNAGAIFVFFFFCCILSFSA